MLPYIRTSQPVQVRGITFRNSEDVAHLSDARREAFPQLLALFVTPGGRAWRDVVYACLDGNVGEPYVDVVNPLAFGRALPVHYRALVDQVWEAHTLIRAINSSPDGIDGRPLLPLELSTLFLCQYFHIIPTELVDPDPWPVQAVASPQADRRIGGGGDEGFNALRDWETELWLTRAAPARPHFDPNYLCRGQDLAADIAAFKQQRGHKGLARLIDEAGGSPDRRQRRFFRTLDWYNRACMPKHSPFR